MPLNIFCKAVEYQLHNKDWYFYIWKIINAFTLRQHLANTSPYPTNTQQKIYFWLF